MLRPEGARARVDEDEESLVPRGDEVKLAVAVEVAERERGEPRSGFVVAGPLKTAAAFVEEHGNVGRRTIRGCEVGPSARVPVVTAKPIRGVRRRHEEEEMPTRALIASVLFAFACLVRAIIRGIGRCNEAARKRADAARFLASALRLRNSLQREDKMIGSGWPGSQVGAAGICQFMPATWRDAKSALNISQAVSVFHPEYNIQAAAYYMGTQYRIWKSPRPMADRHNLATAGYNAGAGHLISAQKLCGNPSTYKLIIPCLPQVTGKNSKETMDYVTHIRGFYAELKKAKRETVPDDGL